jgi:type VI secretion system protein ImpK
MSEEAGQTGRRGASATDLVAYAAPVFDLVLRLKALIVQPSNELRPQIAAMLKDFETRAQRHRFSDKIIQVAKFALAAFVDEAVLTNNFPLKEEWEKYPLQLQYFGEHLAGEKFFDKLEAMLKQIDVTKDAVEVYYVCMLLGFKGKYAVYEQDKLLNTMQRTADALVKSGKITRPELSPHWLSEDQPTAPEKKGMPGWVKLAAFGGLGFAVVLYLVMFLLSSKFLDDAMKRLQL